MKQDNEDLRGLVDHLAQALQEENYRESLGKSEKPTTSHHSAARPSERSGQASSAQAGGTWQWQDWHIQRIDGGMNGRLFRATGAAGDVAVKFAGRNAIL